MKNKSDSDGEQTEFTTWFKAMRSDDAMELLGLNSNAFALLYVIAYRAQRTHKFNRFGLKPGEAPIGDYRNCGMSERQYRTAKLLLSKHGFATFKATSSGTIATLTNTRVFDVNPERIDKRNDKQTTSERQTSGEQATTSKNANNANNEKESPKRADEVTDFIALWKQEFQNHFGYDYFGEAGDDSAARQLLAREDAIGFARSAWRNFKSGFHSKHAASISGFASKFNDIVAEVGSPMLVAAGKENEGFF